MKKTLVFAILIIIVIAVGFFIFKRPANQAPVQYKDLIRVTSPLPNAKISSPLTITGEARGNWYFEASFPMKLLDGNGRELVVTYIQAQGEWMTTEYVLFERTITFSAPSTPTGTLVLEKDNPSGLPEYADEFRIPVRFR